MDNQAFHFEINDLITQFIAAFDDCVIKRFTGNRVSKSEVSVRYVYGPKHAVIHDIVNPAKNITLPVVTVNITQLARDPTRVFNKHDGMYYPAANPVDKYAEFSNQLRMPVPVNISVNMSIIAKYQNDIEQIISNFAAYTNPYIILSWKVPSAFGLRNVHEIRSEVEWSGSINLDYPLEQGQDAKYRLTADTSFVIKGWLFPEAPSEPLKNIYFIDANFYATKSLSGNPLNFVYSTYDDYSSLSAVNYNGSTESIYISAAPIITDIFYNNRVGIGQAIDAGFTINNFNSGGVITLFGKQFNYTTNILLSSNNAALMPGLTGFDFTYYDSVSGVILTSYQVLNENIITINMPALTASGEFSIIVVNEAGYDTTYNAVSGVFSNTI